MGAGDTCIVIGLSPGLAASFTGGQACRLPAARWRRWSSGSGQAREILLAEPNLGVIELARR